MAGINMSIRTDSELKAQAEQVFSQLGMNMPCVFGYRAAYALQEMLEYQTIRQNVDQMLEMPEPEKEQQTR